MRASRRPGLRRIDTPPPCETLMLHPCDYVPGRVILCSGSRGVKHSAGRTDAALAQSLTGSRRQRPRHTTKRRDQLRRQRHDRLARVLALIGLSRWSKLANRRNLARLALIESSRHSKDRREHVEIAPQQLPQPQRQFHRSHEGVVARLRIGTSNKSRSRNRLRSEEYRNQIACKSG